MVVVAHPLVFSAPPVPCVQFSLLQIVERLLSFINTAGLANRHEVYSREEDIPFAKNREEAGTTRGPHLEEPSLVNSLLPTCQKKEKSGKGV